LQAGERVLIHGAAGGVGLAAIQYAQHIGAEIFATAGTDAKRHMLQLLGLEEDHILDSRSLKFADDVLRITGGQGVDVILNSLSGEAIHKNLSILRPFGRFLELGKRDFYENSRIGLKFFRNNLTYHGIDADQLMLEKPDLAQRLFAEMIGLFETGIFRALPYRVFSHDQLSQAFRYMQQAKQVGKVIIRPPEIGAEPAVEASGEAGKEPATIADELVLDGRAAYLVTGGLRGFGLATAEWLARKGAGALILASRSGIKGAEDQASVDRLQNTGATVFAEPCDVTNLAALGNIISSANAAGFPLRGIIHGAAVFEDSLIESIEPQQYRAVLAPKIIGADNLDAVSQDLTLDFFVLYSSITTAFGSPGQASYVTANRYLEGLAERRLAAGLCASVIGWGPISDAGYLTRNEDIQDALLAKMGTLPLKVAEAMAELEKSILHGDGNRYIAPMDWQRLRGVLPGLRGRTYEQVAGGRASEATDGDVEELINHVLEMSPIEAHEFVVELLRAEIGQVLRLTGDKVDVTKSVFDLGMDSLMALELRLAVEQRMGIEVPPMVLSEGGSIADLAGYVVRLISGEEKEADADGELRARLSKHMDAADMEALSKVL
jgi:phthiocerol/phenolphthiocerol synthesis type-I polyketide synthase C